MTSIRKNFLRILLPFLVTAFPGGCSKPQPVQKSGFQETRQQRDARMEWWRQARFGMFIHWGIYAVPAGRYHDRSIKGAAEWIMHNARIPVKEYEKFAFSFNPVGFDAQQWVSLARDAGMRYMVITSKHHDGFSMYRTGVNQYNIIETTPYGKDPMIELSRACRDSGIKFCFYYSIMDWHHPSQVFWRANWKADAAVQDSQVAASREKYLAGMKSQLRELVDQYDPAMLWFDGEWENWWTAEDGEKLESYVRGLKPGLVINNRVVKRRPQDGDFGTPEQEIPDTGLDYDWETCMTMNDTWGFHQDDHNWKSAEDLIRKLVDIASKGGNFLLNVGPTSEGLIPQPSVDRLREMGRWLKINGEAIYGTTASPFKRPEWGRFTARPGRLYAHVFDWPKDCLLRIPPVQHKIGNIYFLADPSRTGLRFEETEGGITVLLPQEAPDPAATVIAIEFGQ